MARTRRNPDLYGDLLMLGATLGLGVVGLHILETKFPATFGALPDPIAGFLEAGNTVQSAIAASADPTKVNPRFGGTGGNAVTKGGTGGQPTCTGLDIRLWPDAAALVKLASQWRLARSANGQDPDDWNAFVVHVKKLTVPGVGMSNYFGDWLDCPWVGWPDAWYFGGVLNYGTTGIPFASNPGG